jgi:hypothetical protein
MTTPATLAFQRSAAAQNSLGERFRPASFQQVQQYYSSLPVQTRKSQPAVGQYIRVTPYCAQRSGLNRLQHRVAHQRASDAFLFASLVDIRQCIAIIGIKCKNMGS